MKSVTSAARGAKPVEAVALAHIGLAGGGRAASVMKFAVDETVYSPCTAVSGELERIPKAS
jgi:hypothetical protein